MVRPLMLVVSTITADATQFVFYASPATDENHQDDILRVAKQTIYACLVYFLHIKNSNFT
jgi:hypothetical protein